MTQPISKSISKQSIACELETTSAALMSKIAKEFIQSGRGIGEFIDIAKFAFCAAAETHIGEKGGRLTTSRIALLTGLSRSKVGQLRKRRGPITTSNHLRPRHLRVVDGWTSDPNYLDGEGKPKQLPKRGKNSFETLCKQYSGDIPARAVLEELLACDLAAVSVQKNVILMQGSF
jgi:Family of unknown function (DUF6502)